MRCVTEVRYAVNVNGELTDPVVPTRGIRQGDPISPYQFILCTEGLSCLLKKKEEEDELKGCVMAEVTLKILLHELILRAVLIQ